MPAVTLHMCKRKFKRKECDETSGPSVLCYAKGGNSSSVVALSDDAVSSRALFIEAHVLHEAHIVVLEQFTVFKEIRTFVLGHGGNKLIDDIVWNKRMAKVELGNVRL